MVVSRGWGRGTQSQCLVSACTEQFVTMKGVLEMDGGDGCTTVGMLFNALNCVRKCFPGGSDGKRLPAMWETRVRSLGWEDTLEKEMATHSSTLAWKIPWTEEPGRLQSIRLHWTRLSNFTSLVHIKMVKVVNFMLFVFYHRLIDRQTDRDERETEIDKPRRLPFPLTHTDLQE